MTAPAPVVTITPEWIQWFSDYYKRNREWGIFHVSLADDNFKLGASDHIWAQPPYTQAELRRAAAWFNKLSASQRRRLRDKAEDLANTVVRR